MPTPPQKKTLISIAHDTFMAGISFVLALYLRLGENFDYADPALLPGTITFTVVCFAVFLFLGVHRRSWRYVSSYDLLILVKAVTLSILIFLPLMFLLNRLEGMPRSVLFINWLVLLALVAGSRVMYRMMVEKALPNSSSVSTDKIPVLLVGVNNYSEMFLREVVGNPYSEYRVVGILDNKPDTVGQTIRNIKIYGDVSKIKEVVEKLQIRGKAPHKVIIAPDVLEGTTVKTLYENAESLGLTMARLPRLTDFTDSKGKEVDMRPIALEDLLGRPQNALDRDSMRALIDGKRVMVTGAGGTIGSELIRQIAGYAPQHISLFELAEHNLYLIDKELEEQFPEVSKRPIIGDVRDRAVVEHAITVEKPDLIFHAAALKHVPMSEQNAIEAALTNIVGTQHVAEACNKAGVEAMVFISTDKAVNPANVMGATKRAAELYLQALSKAKEGKEGPFYVTLRFGNVLGSTGSVIPLFKRQLAAGGPLTVTDPETTRYFMTVREAVELVLQAAAMSIKDRHCGGTYVLDMGEPVLIKDLAEQMIQLSGLKPEEDITIEYTGLRSGEKLHEELFYPSENPEKTEYEDILHAHASDINLADIEPLFKNIADIAENYDSVALLSLLETIVPEFKRPN